MADLSAAKSASQGAVVQGTNKKQSLSWTRYKNYLSSIGFYDIFLESFSRAQRHRILAAFAHALQEGRFSARNNKTIKADSIRSSLDHVAQAFKLADFPDPRLDNEGKFAFILQ
jgi:hypothetical protein